MHVNAQSSHSSYLTRSLSRPLCSCTRTREINKMLSIWQTSQFREISQHTFTLCDVLKPLCTGSQSSGSHFAAVAARKDNMITTFQNFPCHRKTWTISDVAAVRWTVHILANHTLKIWHSIRFDCLSFLVRFLQSQKLYADCMVIKTKITIFSNYQKCLFKLARRKSSAE